MSAVHVAICDGYWPETWVVELKDSGRVYLCWVRACHPHAVRSQEPPQMLLPPLWVVLDNKKRVSPRRVPDIPPFASKEEALQRAEEHLLARSAADRLAVSELRTWVAVKKQ